MQQPPRFSHLSGLPRYPATRFGLATIRIRTFPSNEYEAVLLGLKVSRNLDLGSSVTAPESALMQSPRDISLSK